MATQPNTEVEPKCAVCHGRKSEHFDDEGRPKTQHAFTELEGDLVTHQQNAKRQPKSPTVIQLPGGTQNEGGAINRLIETLLNKGALTTDEALYVCGIGPKPEPPSGYRDPVSSGGVKGAVDV
jgi:hypothetical protein